MKRAVLFRNGTQISGKLVAVPNTLDELLTIASEKLLFDARHVYTAQGGEVDDIALIRSDEVLYVSGENEPFVRPIRVILFRNGTQNDAILLWLMNSVDKLLKIATLEFGFEAKHIYTAQGAEVNDVTKVRSDEDLYVTGDEAFMPIGLRQRGSQGASYASNKSSAHNIKVSALARAEGSKIPDVRKDEMGSAGFQQDSSELIREELSAKKSNYGATDSGRKEDDWIRLNVGGTYFTTSRTTMLKEPSSMLAKMFDKDLSMNPSIMDKTGAYMIDRDPTYFRAILNYLRDGDELTVDSNISRQGVLREARYFGIESLSALESTSIVKLNVGGKHLFTSRATLDKIKDNKIDLSPSNMDDSGSYYVDRSPAYFERCLHLLRGNKVLFASQEDYRCILSECRYFGLSIINYCENKIGWLRP